MFNKSRIESGFENLLFSSRWLMAPMYLGLALALFALIVVFLHELWSFVLGIPQMTGKDAILAALSLIDLTLAANLVLIVLFSGYENFVSKLDITAKEDRPEWMGKVDFQGLKIKLIASIVAISAIDLLKAFMAIEAPGYDIASHHQKILWMVVIHFAFVVSGVLLALMDWLESRGHHH